MVDSSKFSNMGRLFSTAGQAPTQQGTGYTNLARIAQANVGAGQQLGQKVASDVGSQISGVKTQLQKQQEQFETEKEKELGKLSESERSQILGRFTAPSSTPSTAPTQEEISKFGTFLAGEYKGPSGLANTGALSSQASGIAKQTSALTPSSTQELLRRSVGGDRYTSGQSRLDALLLGKQAAESLRPVQREAAQLGQQITQAQTGAEEKAKLAEAQARQFGEQTKQQLTGAQSEIEKSVQGQLKAAQETEQQRQNFLKQVQSINQGYSSYDETGKENTDSKGNLIKYKVDASGNLIKDPTTGKAIQATDSDIQKQSDFNKLLTLESTLKDKVAQEDLEKLFGKGGVTQSKADVQKSFLDIWNKLAPQYSNIMSFPSTTGGMTASSIGGGASKYYDMLNPMLSRAIERDPYLEKLSGKEAQAYSDLGKQSVINKYLQEGLWGKQVDINLPGITRMQSNIEGALGSVAPNLLASLIQKSGLEQNIAQNVTEQGIASAQQRANYEALQKLLSRGDVSGSKYRTYTTPEEEAAQSYKAGKLVFDPTQI